MLIHTQNERNLVECCGCSWPLFPAPLIDEQTNWGEFTPTGYTNPPDCAIYRTYEGGIYSDPWTFADVLAQAHALQTGFTDGPGLPAFTDQHYVDCSGTKFPTYTGVNDARYRWVPQHGGPYFKILWDEITVGFDSEELLGAPLEDLTFISATPKSQEWTDGRTHGDWNEIAAPSSAFMFTETRIANIRFWSYRHARCGVAPQITGVGYDIPT